MDEYHEFCTQQWVAMTYNWVTNGGLALVGSVCQISSILRKHITIGISRAFIWLGLAQSVLGIVYGIGVDDSSQWGSALMSTIVTLFIIGSMWYVDRKSPHALQAALIHTTAVHGLKHMPSVRNALDPMDGLRKHMREATRSPGRPPAKIDTHITCSGDVCQLRRGGEVISECSVSAAIEII